MNTIGIKEMTACCDNPIQSPQYCLCVGRTMSSQAKVIVGVLLLLQAACCVLAVPVHSTVKQTDSAREEDGGPGLVLERHRRRSWPVMNDYILQFVINASSIRDSNCSDPFFGQSVSQEFCSSDKVTVSYSSTEGKK